MKRHNPFQVQSTRSIYENKWIQVFEHEILTPKNTPGIYGVVKFKNRAVGVIPYEDGNIWLVGQYRFPLDLYSWEIPEGGSPMGEDLVETAKRELLEETGIVAGHIEKILEMHLSNSVSDEYGIIFLACELKQEAPNPEDTEELEVIKVPLEHAYQQVVSGEITDSLSVAGILRLMLMKREGRL